MKKQILFILFTLITISVFSCSCPFPETAKEEIKKSDFVIVGKVISKSWIKSEDGNYFHIEVELKESFKGDFKTKMISLKTGPPLPSCGFNFKVGKIYAIYAYCSEIGINTSQCTRTTKNWRKEKKEIKRCLTKNKTP